MKKYIFLLVAGLDKGLLSLGITYAYWTQYGTEPHILMEAPSRSGKGVGFVVPNCLNYHGSIVVLDIIKGRITP